MKFDYGYLLAIDIMSLGLNPSSPPSDLSTFFTHSLQISLSPGCDFSVSFKNSHNFQRVSLASLFSSSLICPFRALRYRVFVIFLNFSSFSGFPIFDVSFWLPQPVTSADDYLASKGTVSLPSSCWQEYFRIKCTFLGFVFQLILFGV